MEWGQLEWRLRTYPAVAAREGDAGGPDGGQDRRLAHDVGQRQDLPAFARFEGAAETLLLSLAGF